MELTILMPCLNEEETIAFSINEAKRFLDKYNIDGEILIADNGSSDSSAQIAFDCGARVISVTEKGYGAALIGGINEAKGRYIIMGDCDGSYDFLNLEPFLEGLRDGYKLVMGNRFLGGIEEGAMPALHKIGVPFLSTLARWKFKAPVYDFHCGLRGFEASMAQNLNLKCTGMEFATEIIAAFARSGALILEVPTRLRKDLRSRKPHLKTFRDGFRHLKYILMS